MGIYDRDYQRDRGYDDAPGFHLGGSRTWTTNLVLLMGAVYVLQLLTRPAAPGGDAGWITDTFSLYADLPRRPWLAFELVTYGFLHSVRDFKHILFNAFVLWMFGRTVEQRYGSKEFLTFYLAAVVFAGLTWIAGEFLARGQLAGVPMIGASGGIAGVLLLFCLNFPHQRVFIWGVLPMPAWLFAVMFVGLDVLGAVHEQTSNVAYSAHIGGAIFGFIYFRSKIRLSRWLPATWKLPKLRRRPPLRVVDPTADEEDESTDEVVDDILRKIREQGQESLTRRERRILEEASREYQKRRH